MTVSCHVVKGAVTVVMGVTRSIEVWVGPPNISYCSAPMTVVQVMSTPAGPTDISVIRGCNGGGKQVISVCGNTLTMNILLAVTYVRAESGTRLTGILVPGIMQEMLKLTAQYWPILMLSVGHPHTRVVFVGLGMIQSGLGSVSMEPGMSWKEPGMYSMF